MSSSASINDFEGSLNSARVKSDVLNRPRQKRENVGRPRVLRQFDAQSCTACGYRKLI